MKPIIHFISGFVLGSIIGLFVVYGAFYLYGYTMSYLGVQQYGSFDDGQRNFEIYIYASIAVGVLSGLFSGYWLSKKHST